MIEPSAEVQDLRRQLAEAQAQAAALREALTKISGGSFDGASSLAINGLWPIFANRLQGIAKQALAASRQRVRQETIEECAKVADNAVPHHTGCGLKIARMIRTLARDGA